MNFKLSDVTEGKTVLQGTALGGATREGLVKRILRGKGFEVDDGIHQNTILVRDCRILEEEEEEVILALVAGGAGMLRRTDSTLKPGQPLYGVVDHAWWAAEGVEPDFAVFADGSIADMAVVLDHEKQPWAPGCAAEGAWQRQMSHLRYLMPTLTPPAALTPPAVSPSTLADREEHMRSYIRKREAEIFESHEASHRPSSTIRADGRSDLATDAEPRGDASAETAVRLSGVSLSPHSPLAPHRSPPLRPVTPPSVVRSAEPPPAPTRPAPNPPEFVRPPPLNLEGLLASAVEDDEHRLAAPRHVDGRGTVTPTYSVSESESDAGFDTTPLRNAPPLPDEDAEEAEEQEPENTISITIKGSVSIPMWFLVALGGFSVAYLWMVAAFVSRLTVKT